MKVVRRSLVIGIFRRANKIVDGLDVSRSQRWLSGLWPEQLGQRWH